MAAAIDGLVADLNPPQREAVLHDGGPLVVVAGAGSGKTRVLTRRIARLVASGVPPWRILAITFTNKAADEMRRRVVELVGPDAERMWVSTFHAACVRMLRRNVERIGYRPGFTIYDDGDSRRLVEHVLDDLGVDQRRFPPRAVLGVISSAKSDLVDAEAFAGAGRDDLRASGSPRPTPSTSGASWRRTPWTSTTCLVRTVRMFREHPEVLEHYQERFEHVLVDEYQDTNVAQNELVILLGAGPAQRLRRRRHRPEHLPVPGRRDAQPARVRAGLPRCPHDRARPELPVHPDDPRRRQRGDRQQPPPPGEEPLERPRHG